MSQLTEQYAQETGEKAMYRMRSSDYHTLRYVNWLEKKFEGVQNQTNNNARDKIFRPCGAVCCVNNERHECQLPECQFRQRKTSPVA